MELSQVHDWPFSFLSFGGPLVFTFVSLCPFVHIVKLRIMHPTSMKWALVPQMDGHICSSFKCHQTLSFLRWSAGIYQQICSSFVIGAPKQFNDFPVLFFLRWCHQAVIQVIANCNKAPWGYSVSLCPTAVMKCWTVHGDGQGTSKPILALAHVPSHLEHILILIVVHLFTTCSTGCLVWVAACGV